MCRFTLYIGTPILLSSLLIDPAHSLIRQSTHSREREEPLNGDGFGVGWYASEYSIEPAVFRSITPAWNNRNLQNLCRVVTSPCIMAHVRAATQSSGVNEANCHPFRYGKYLCMHNGDIGNFRQVRRKLLDSVCDDAHSNVYGSTDSEHFFALYIDEILKRHTDGVDDMAEALRDAIHRVVDFVRKYGDDEPSYLNVAISDGKMVVVSRFTNDVEDSPESLYYFSGPLYKSVEDEGDELPLIVSSERLSNHSDWQEVPANHIIKIRHGEAPSFLAI